MGGVGEHFPSQFLTGYGLVDGAVVVRPSMVGPTLKNTQGVAKRLDYIFFSRAFSLLSGKCLPNFFSDHDGVLFKVRVSTQGFGPGWWHLNIKVLGEENFVCFMSWFGRVVALRPMCSGILEWWEVFKEQVKDLCLTHHEKGKTGKTEG